MGTFVKMNKLMSPVMLKSVFELSLLPVIVTPLHRLPLDTDDKAIRKWSQTLYNNCNCDG